MLQMSRIGAKGAANFGRQEVLRSRVGSARGVVNRAATGEIRKKGKRRELSFPGWKQRKGTIRMAAEG